MDSRSFRSCSWAWYRSHRSWRSIQKPADIPRNFSSSIRPGWFGARCVGMRIILAYLWLCNACSVIDSTESYFTRRRRDGEFKAHLGLVVLCASASLRETIRVAAERSEAAPSGYRALRAGVFVLWITISRGGATGRLRSGAFSEGGPSQY
jgi:hypothetical protein